MRTAVKGALALLGMAIGVPVIIIAWLAVEFNHFYPRKYIRLQNEATEWNDTHWQSGYALHVTLQGTSSTGLESSTAVETLDCYEKKLAWQGGLKGPPGIGKQAYTNGATFLTVPFGTNAQHMIELRDACRDALAHWSEWTLPHVPDRHRYWSYIVPKDKSFSCFMRGDPGSTLGEISRPVFVAVKPIPLRDLMDRATYISLPKDQDRDEFLMLKTYYWSIDTGKSCWRENPNSPCAPEVEAVCGRFVE